MTRGLAFSTNGYTLTDLDDALARIAAAGYRGVEILGDRPHAYPDDVDLEWARRTRRRLADLGLEVSNWNANTSFGFWTDPPPEPIFEPSLVSDNPDLRAHRRRLILRALDLAAEIGARCVSITTGKPLGSMSPERCEPVLADELAVVLDRAAQLGLRIGIECEPGLYLERSRELADWIARMGSPLLGANLDLGHSVVAGESSTEAVELLADRIWNIHIEDIRAAKHYHRIPGDGDIDFAAIADALQRTGYAEWVTVELYTQTADPDTAARRSIAALGPLFNPGA